MTKPVAALLALVVCALAGRAEATVLFAGGEDVDFLCGLNLHCNVSTNGALFRSNWARAAYWVPGQGTADPPSFYFSTPAFAGNATVWIHAQFCPGSGGLNTVCTDNGTVANNQMLRVIDSAGNATLIVRGTGTTGQLKISSRTSGGTFTDLVTCPSAIPQSLLQLDLFINYQTSGGEVTLYTNSNSICDYTGNVTNGDGATTLTAVQFSDPYNDSTNSAGAYWSEVIVATTDTRAMNLFTLYPNGSGNATQWSNSSGSTPCTSLIGGVAINDSNYVYTGSNTQIEECTVKNTIPVGSYNALALVMSGRLMVGSSGPQHVDFLTRTGGTDYPSNDFAPNNSLNNLSNYIQAVNPATSNPWVISDFTASGFNIGLESKP